MDRLLISCERIMKGIGGLPNYVQCSDSIEGNVVTPEDILVANLSQIGLSSY